MNFSKLFITVGLLLLVIGLVMNYAPWLVNWFGKLPGDIRVEKENSFFFFPITSMIVVSIVFSIIINLFFKH
ncbi:MAG: DUF2905 domain-containing protein [Gammaproteobacteria bacterium]|nr:DUF2905 domain-containing protein [Gammaproteobacteria bacterium]